VRIISAHDVFVRFAVPANQAAPLIVGQEVMVYIGESRFAASGKIEKIAPDVDAASRMIFVEADLPPIDPQTHAFAGEMARVSVKRVPASERAMP